MHNGSSLGKRIVKAPKIYFLDIGLVCALTGIRTEDTLFRGPLAGPLFENFWIQETVKRFVNRGEQPPLYFLRTAGGLEVDLLIERSHGAAAPVEIKLNKTPSLSLAASLVKFRKSFPSISVGDGMLLSLTDRSLPLAPGISAPSLDEYLAAV